MNNDFELKYQWLIEWDITNDTDYLLWTENPLEIPENKNTKNYFYNQGTLKRTRNACVLYANAASLWYLMNYEFSDEELLEIVASAEKDYWWKEDRGMYISRWVDCVRHYWNNKFPDRKVKTFKMIVGDKDFAEALRMNHRVVVWYRTSREYYKDAQSDWIVDWEKFIDFTWGHAVSSIFGAAEVISSEEWILIQDNYTGTKPFNIYYNNKIAKLKKSGTFFPSAFVYLKEETMEDKIRKNIDLEAAKVGFDLWIFNWLDPRKPVSRQEVVVMIIRWIWLILKLLSKARNTEYSLKDLEKETK